jgi:hypothetical protein
MSSIKRNSKEMIESFVNKYSDLNTNKLIQLNDKGILKMTFHQFLIDNQNQINSLYISNTPTYLKFKKDLVALFEELFFIYYTELVKQHGKNDLILFIMMMKKNFSGTFDFSSVSEIEAELNSVVDKSIKKDKKGCYIATMAYGDYEHPQVVILRNFRDKTLAKSLLGRWFVRTYYHYSPILVEKLKDYHWINKSIRTFLNLLIKFIK